MDLSGRTNMDLTEAARLMKQTTTSTTTTNPAQMQPPPLMMMQQAVAMQQFQFQQALLMQQVMATQQAAARAATVKSAAEMAAARAAEISKQLKGSDAEEEEKKPVAASPSRSKSRSLSRSRSVSRSKSRSPIRYRRDRSLSRSPIRYRRDRPYSPSRSRDYYSYRSRSRRGYYRGRGDYPWNPFRRDWDRDRDRDYYPRSRRSRSRSRDRVRRRSRTRSRSPRFRRERTPSPRHRRDERKSTRSSRRSRSRETKRSESSRSLSVSPRRIDNSRSPARKVQESPAVRRVGSESPVPRTHRRGGKELSVSPVREEPVVSSDVKDEEEEEDERSPSLQKEESPEKETYNKLSELPKREVSPTPPRSLSVSLNQSLRKDLESDDDVVDVSSMAKKGPIGLTRGESSDVEEEEKPRISPVFRKDIKAKVSSSDVSSDELNVNSKVKREPFSGKSSRTPIKRAAETRSGKGREVISDESEEDKELDDWRDDVKPISRDRVARKDGRREHERRVEEEKKPSKKVTTFHERSMRIIDPVKMESSGKSRKKDDSDLEGVEQAEEEDRIQGRKARTDAGGSGGRKELWRQESFRYRGRSPLAGGDLKEREKQSSRRHMDIEEQEEEDVAPFASKKDEEQDNEEPVFKGSKRPIDDFEALEAAVVRPTLVEDYKDDEESDGVVKVAPTRSKARGGGSDLEDEEEVKVSRGRSTLEQEDAAPVSRKGKEKRSKDRSRHDDDSERERRKERHRRHRKKHRRDEDDENDEDDEDKDDGESRKERRRHRRKHRKEDDDERRDRKKRKHKSRGRSLSDSAGDSPRADDASRDENDGSPIRKKSSSRHRKRRREPSKSPVNSGSSSD